MYIVVLALKVRQICFYEWDMAYEVLICMCWCTYLCIFIVIVYIYIRYTIVMSCIGVYEFFFHSVHLSLKHDVHEAELKYRKRMYLVQYFQIVRQHNRNTVEKISFRGSSHWIMSWTSNIVLLIDKRVIILPMKDEQKCKTFLTLK